MLARCQFGVRDGRCGAMLTYPIKGYPWRRNVMKSYEFTLGPEVIDLLFAEVHRIRKDHPDECLSHEQLWSDATEKGNGITRDRETDTLCYSIGILTEAGVEEQFSLRENSRALLDSALFRIVSGLIAPHEMLSATNSGVAIGNSG